MGRHQSSSNLVTPCKNFNNSLARQVKIKDYHRLISVGEDFKMAANVDPTEFTSFNYPTTPTSGVDPTFGTQSQGVGNYIAPLDGDPPSDGELGWPAAMQALAIVAARSRRPAPRPANINLAGIGSAGGAGRQNPLAGGVTGVQRPLSGVPSLGQSLG